MRIIKDEFYYANEYNAVAEFQAFPAESYTLSKEIATVGKEHADAGEEITTSQKRDFKKATKINGEQDVLKKVMNSLKGVAATSAVAAVAVLGATTISPPPKIDLLELSVGRTYVEYTLSIEELQEDLSYFIVINTSNEDARKFPVEESGVQQNRIDELKPDWEYSLSVVGYDEYWGETTYFEKTFQTISSLPDYEVGISNVSISSLNEIRIDFWCDGLDDKYSVEFWLDYANGEPQDVVPVTQSDLSQGYVTLPVLQTATFVSVTPVVKRGEGGTPKEFAPYTHSFDNTLDAKVRVDKHYGEIVFYLKAIANNATHVSVTNTETSEVVWQEELYGDYVTIPYDDSQTAILQYTLSLTDSQGEKVTSDFTAVIDPAVQAPETYVFNYKNANDVGITYNQDGTINVYIQTNFACEDENLYYQVVLGETRIQSRAPMFMASGLENIPYGLVYELCYDSNGIQYVLSTIPVSGVVNEFYFDGFFTVEISNHFVSLQISDYLAAKVDLNSVRLVSSANEELILTETDFVYNEEYGEYVCNAEFTMDFETITLYAYCAPFAKNMDGIEDYVGSLSTEFQTIIDNNG